MRNTRSSIATASTRLTLQMTPSQSKMNTSTSLSISSIGLDSRRTLAIWRDVAVAAYAYERRAAAGGVDAATAPGIGMRTPAARRRPAAAATGGANAEDPPAERAVVRAVRASLSLIVGMFFLPTSTRMKALACVCVAIRCKGNMELKAGVPP